MDKYSRQFAILILDFVGLVNFAYADEIKLDAIYPATENEQKPSALWLSNQKPLPTNSWFINLVLNQEDKKLSDPVNIFPYLAAISPQGLGLSYTNPVYYAEPEYPDLISASYYQFENQLNIGTVEDLSTYGVSAYHGLKISLQWQNSEQQKMTALIVQGSPYVTVIFSNARPKLNAKYKLISVNKQPAGSAISPAKRFELVFELDSKNTQTWILYSENLLDLEQDANSLVAKDAYTGWLRVVLQQDTQTQLSNDLNTLDAYSQTIVLDYEQTYSANSYEFSWQTQDGKAPLMLTLPHQRSSVVAASKVSYQGIKGLMLGETTAKWNLALPKISLVFLEKKIIAANQKLALTKALKADVNELLTRPFPDDGPYQVGKRLTRAARILLIADELKESKLKSKLLSRLKEVITKKMLENKSWKFEYDSTWGGIIPSIDDYGARHYNDHHYHYGYWIYALAVIGKFDPAWLSTPLKPKAFSPKDWADKLIRDYANEDSHDPYFPKQRYQDDYSGHSWASGLRAFKNGQNQQSSSEAVHAYYALALYAKVTSNSHLYDWAEFLMAREFKAAQIYWQIQKNNTVYSEKFKAANSVVANLWDSKIDANAFFVKCKDRYRCGLEYSYGIEMLPFTAMTQELLAKDWLKNAYPILKKLIANEYGGVTAAWKWILIKGLVTILTPAEKQSFFSEALDSKAEEYDDGDSKTNTLYFLI